MKSNLSDKINLEQPNLLLRGDPRLELKSTAMDKQDRVDVMVQALHSTLCRYREQTGFGRAISAPQIGLLKRLIVLDLGAGPVVLANPEISWRSEAKRWVWDDCLSVPDILVKIKRYVSISVRYQDELGRERHWQQLNQDMSELIQHEMDHLDGVLMTEHREIQETRPITDRAELLAQSRKQSRLSLKQVRKALTWINPTFLHSPQYSCEPLSEALGCEVLCKLETLNPIRSFKGRGASFLLASLQDQMSVNIPPLVAASAGNWGQALAFECRRLGWPLTIFAAKTANPLKLQRMAAMGAKLQLVGDDFDTAKSAAKRFARESSGLFLEDGLQAEVTEGHATMAYELLRDRPALDAVVAALGNGALLNGIGLWSKAFDPAIAVIGACAEGASCMHDSWQQGPDGPIVEHDSVNTIADGIGVRKPIPEAVHDMQGLVDDILLVNDQHLLQAMRLAQQHLGVLLEPAGAAGLAAILAHSKHFAGKQVGVVLGGSNLNEAQRKRWLT